MWSSNLFLTAFGGLCLLGPVSAEKLYTCFMQGGGFNQASSTCASIEANSNYNPPFNCYHTACLINKGPMDPGCSLTLFDENGCPIIGTSDPPGNLHPFSTVYLKARLSFPASYKVGFQTDGGAGDRQVVIYPTAMPSPAPIAAPVPEPTYSPTADPTSQPSSSPSSSPSTRPTVLPTSVPSSEPSSRPSAAPSGEPSSRPSSAPTVQPTAPTFAPTISPTFNPTVVPTARPTLEFHSRYVLAIRVKQVAMLMKDPDC